MMTSDLPYAFRRLVRRPGFALLTVLVVTTGIGLSAFLFSFLNTLVFKDLPFEDGDTLVQLSASQNGLKTVGALNLHDHEVIRNELDELREYGTYTNLTLAVAGADGARRYSGVAAEPNLFEITRTEPLLGRGFVEADNRPAAEPVVVLGHEVWSNRFAQREDVLGEVLRINGESYRVVGVMPEGYYFPLAAEMWVPLRESATQVPRREASKVFGLAHLAEGTSVSDVNARLDAVMQRLENEYPETNNATGAYVTAIPMLSVEDGAPVVRTMQVVVFLILILAAINVASLMLSRALERSKETAVRMALGAPRLRLIVQSLWESAIICTAGGLIALVAIGIGLRVTERTLASFTTERPAFWWDFGIDGYTVGIVVAFVLTAIVVTGLLPALKTTGADFNAVLRDGTRGAQSRSSGRLNRLLVICEIFLSLAVLIAAGVMAIGNYKVARADYGASPEGITSAQVSLTGGTYDTPESKARFFDRLEAELESSERVEDVMIASALPGEKSVTPTMAIEGREYTKEGGFPRANLIAVTAGTLEGLGVELLEGRHVDSSDEIRGGRSVVVTDSFAARHFGDASALGQRLRVVEGADADNEWLTIIGVVRHTVQGSPAEESGRTPSVFRAFAQDPRSRMSIAVRSAAGTSAMSETVRRVLASIDPELPAFRIEPYSQVFHRITAPLQFGTALFLMFGVAAAILASSGIYGVMSNATAQRTQEIGIKRALGAEDGRITREFLGQGGRQLLWGGVPGLLAGAGMGFGMSAMLGVGGTELALVTLTFALLIAAIVLTASYLPTLRALRLEPVDALRHA